MNDVGWMFLYRANHPWTDRRSGEMSERCHASYSHSSQLIDLRSMIVIGHNNIHIAIAAQPLTHQLQVRFDAAAMRRIEFSDVKDL